MKKEWEYQRTCKHCGTEYKTTVKNSKVCGRCKQIGYNNMMQKVKSHDGTNKWEDVRKRFMQELE